jgi:hypothetical protein
MAIAWHRSLIGRTRHVVRSRMSEHPALYLPFARRKYPGPSPEVIGPQTQLVIDAYTRSATTFAVYALQLAQDKPVRLAHHLHAPAQLIAAARRGVPALLLIRTPRDAILSQLTRESHVALRDAVVAYTRFHTCLAPYRDRMVVADFETVTHDFGSVIRRLNARFGLSLVEFVHSDASMRDCFALIQQRGTLSPVLLGFESGLVSESEMRRDQQLRNRAELAEPRDAWIPSAKRRRTKEALAQQWERPDLAELRERAQAAYESFVALAEAEPVAAPALEASPTGLLIAGPARNSPLPETRGGEPASQSKLASLD